MDLSCNSFRAGVALPSPYRRTAEPEFDQKSRKILRPVLRSLHPQGCDREGHEFDYRISSFLFLSTCA
jgi:hypothetical protein